MKIFFSVGEPSGDLHGANLIRSLRADREDLEFVGYGGPQMATAGCRLHTDLTELAVMGFSRVLFNLHTFWNLISAADRYFRSEKPDAVVLIDYPGFNWWIARRAKAHGIAVYYYGTPQIWAWARWRVRKLRRLIDHVLVKLPFEEKWYRQRGCQATFIGHPFFDEVRRYQHDQQWLAEHQPTIKQQTVAILPGSRTQEVAHNFQHLLQAAKHVHAQVPGVRFLVAAYRQQHAEQIRETIAANDLPPEFSIEVHSGRTPEIVRLATCCMAVSGSVSLELLYHTKPTVIQYYISPLMNFLQSFVRRVKYITLVNLLVTNDIERNDRKNYDPRAEDAEAVLMPEYLTSTDRSADVAYHIVEWLTNSEALEENMAELAKLKAKVAGGGASVRAAHYILATLGERTAPLPRPHFRVPSAQWLENPVTRYE